MEIKRRSILKSILALPAVAVAAKLPTEPASKVAVINQNTLEEFLRQGIPQYNKTFYIGRSLSLKGVKNLNIRNCTFIMKDDVEYIFNGFELQNASGQITECAFMNEKYLTTGIG